MALNVYEGLFIFDSNRYARDPGGVSAQVEDFVQKLGGEVSRLAPAEFAPDERIARGGCRVETHYGAIDQQFENQLARIEQELT